MVSGNKIDMEGVGVVGIVSSGALGFDTMVRVESNRGSWPNPIRGGGSSGGSIFLKQSKKAFNTFLLEDVQVCVFLWTLH